MSDPDSGKFREEIQKLDLVISLDMFMNETARYARLRPARGRLAREGRHVHEHRAARAARPHGGPAARRGRPARLDGLPRPGRPPRLLGHELPERPRRSGTRSAGSLPRGSAASATRGSISSPASSGPARRRTTRGREYLYDGGVFAKPDGKAHLRPVLFDPYTIPDGEAMGFKDAICGHIYEHADDEYPFIVTTGRRVMHYHTGTMTRKSPLLEQLAPEEKIEINPADAARLSVREGRLHPGPDAAVDSSWHVPGSPSGWRPATSSARSTSGKRAAMS